MTRLWYKQPAKVWEEALPLGNGRMGAMVYGKVWDEEIQLNEESMWYGGKVDRNNPDALENLPKIRKLLRSGQIKKAEQLMRYALSGTPKSEHPYQSLGNMNFRFFMPEPVEEKADEKMQPDSAMDEHGYEERMYGLNCAEGIIDKNSAEKAKEEKSEKYGAEKAKTEDRAERDGAEEGRAGKSKTDNENNMKETEGISNYSRELDLERAIVTTKFTCNKITWTREVFISHPDDCLVMHITADQPRSICFDVHLLRERFYDGVKKAGTDGICLYGNLGKGGADFSMQLTARAKGGEVQVIGEHLIVDNADEATLYFCANTTFQTKDAEQANVDAIHRAEKFSYVELKERHIRDYQNLFQRMQLKLVTDEAYAHAEKEPTDVRMSKIADGEEDIAMMQTYFQFGRYLLISSSRPGTLPATLQGIWNQQMKPSWDSKYTININTEMNYWLAETCNLSECHLPLFDLIKKMVPNGEKTAKVMYGCRGFVAHHNTDIWGDTAVQDFWNPGSYWVMGAAWLCTHQWTHYIYTKDVDFLKENFPIMRKAALFFLDFLIEDDGYLKTCPSVSPENTYILPNGERGANGVGVTMDNQILRDLFTQCIKAAEILGIEDDLNEQIKDARNRLMPTKIGRFGQIMEWEKDYEEADPGHRHISHLYGLFPSEQISVDGTPELAKAARITLERRLSNGGGHTGWSRAWIINHYAKLWDGEKAYFNLQKIMEKSTLPNLFDNHPPFQIDGNFGAAAAIANMLAQSNEERVVLLPALPEKWESGSVKGLCLVGNAVLDLTWKNHRLETYTITAKIDWSSTVKYKDRERTVSLKQGEAYTVESDYNPEVFAKELKQNLY